MKIDDIYKALEALIRDINSLSPKRESKEWYLLNHLTRFQKHCYNNSSVLDLERENYIVTRFIIDSMDWNSDLFKSVSVITGQVDSYIKSVK